jgi:[ribosomal protein S18]-alanine N-acetyltransferase
MQKIMRRIIFSWGDVHAMRLFKRQMDESDATVILGWKYTEPYDFYNNEVTNEAIQELLDGSYYSVIDEQNELIGFFCTGKSAQVPAGSKFDAYKADYIDIGLGMRPNLTGKGYGLLFCSYILTDINTNYKNIPTRLTVATFNTRAIHLYEKLGFIKKFEFKTDYCVFMTMVKESSK